MTWDRTFLSRLFRGSCDSLATGAFIVVFPIRHGVCHVYFSAKVPRWWILINVSSWLFDSLPFSLNLRISRANHVFLCSYYAGGSEVTSFHFLSKIYERTTTSLSASISKRWTRFSTSTALANSRSFARFQSLIYQGETSWASLEVSYWCNHAHLFLLVVNAPWLLEGLECDFDCPATRGNALIRV